MLMNSLNNLSYGLTALGVSINSNVDAKSVGNNLIKYILDICVYGGVGLIIFGAVSIGLAVSNPDAPPNQKLTGVMMILGGAIIAGVSVLLRALGVIG